MWDDWMEKYDDMFRDEYGRLSYKMCDTQYNFNMYEYEREVKFLFQDKTYRHYQLGNCYFEIPVALNQTSGYNKLDYIEKHYPSLNDTQLLKIAKFLSKEIPVAEWHETPKELTPDERFENLKKKIIKRNTVKRKKKIKFMSDEWQRDHEMLASIIVVVFMFSIALLLVRVIKTITIVIL